jgi:zinc protease
MLARLLLLLCCVVGIADAQAQSSALPPLDAPLPIDPAVRTGTLDNGLRWFIRTNARPEKRAELRLVVNAGSVLEDDDQRGLAHFLEHMAFNGTRRFAKNDIVKYLESIGVRFGADLNAYTGFDETVYILPVPTDSAGLLSRSFDILEDWASAVLMDSSEVVAERGVVLEEWRSGRGAQSRVLDTHFPVLFRGSRYAERLPIGDTGIIRGATPAPLRRFYRDWYRPNNMAIVAVGDFNADSVQAMIAARFGSLTNPPAPRTRAAYAVPGDPTTRVSIASDRELTVSSLEVLWQLPPRTTRTVGDWRQRLVEDIYNAAFNRRLGELTQRPDAAWVGAASGLDAYTRSSAAYGLRVAAEDGKIERALEAIAIEARRVDAFGFLESEIARVKTDLLRSYERAYAEREKSESGGFAEAYVGHFLNQAPIPGIAFYNEHAPAAVASITLDEVNAVGRAWISDSNRVIMASLTEKEGVAQPTREALLAALARAAAAPITPWTETLADGGLVTTAPAPGRVAARGRIDELDMTEWTLSNGVRVLLKTTDFKADEVLLSGFAPGGASLYPDARATAAELATTLIERGGAGSLSVIDLQKKLAGKVAAVGTALGERSQDVSGRASPKDLETLFELLWLRFTAPRVDSAAVQAFRQQIGAVLANRSRAPEAAFSDTISLTLANYHPRVQLPTAALFNSVSLDDALAIYRERFGDASGFTFVFVGNVSAEQLEPLLVRWIAALPTSGRTEQPRDLGIRPPPGTVQKVVRAGVEPKSSTVVAYHGERPTTVASRQAFRTFGDILETRLTEELREALGGTYSVGVSASASTQPRDAQQLIVQFGSSPENADTLFAAVQRTLDALRTVGPTAEELASALEKQRRQQEVSVRENSYWMSGVMARLRAGTDPRQLLEAPQIIAGTTVDAVRDAANTLVDPAQFVRVVLLPAQP